MTNKDLDPKCDPNYGVLRRGRNVHLHCRPRLQCFRYGLWDLDNCPQGLGREARTAPSAKLPLRVKNSATCFPLIPPLHFWGFLFHEIYGVILLVNSSCDIIFPAERYPGKESFLEDLGHDILWRSMCEWTNVVIRLVGLTGTGCPSIPDICSTDVSMNAMWFLISSNLPL